MQIILRRVQRNKKQQYSVTCKKLFIFINIRYAECKYRNVNTRSHVFSPWNFVCISSQFEMKFMSKKSGRKVVPGNSIATFWLFLKKYPIISWWSQFKFSVHNFYWPMHKPTTHYVLITKARADSSKRGSLKCLEINEAKNNTSII